MKSRSYGSGRLVQSTGGYEAFVPNPLPPDIDFSPVLLRALSDADRLIGKLAGEGRSLQNPHLLMRPFIKQEAVLSSRIEGTQATLGELLAADAGAFVDRSPDDLREVGNYVTALEYGIKRLSELPLSLRLVTELHEKLMQGVRGEHATPGKFRRSQNWIGSPGCTLQNASYVPPPIDELMPCLAAWETFLHDRSLPPLIQAAMMHSQFEAIHPFLDGNGRVGRLVITLFLVERNILPTPLLYLSAFFEATRSNYYDRLSAVTGQAAWTEWIEYFLNGVARMSEDALIRSESINNLLMDWRQRAVAGNKTPLNILNLLEENPYCTINQISEKLGVAFATAQRGVDKLISLGILGQTDAAKRNRVYCAHKIMDILEEPPVF
ncbi:Fic family protein [Verrucomicrobiota bacterium]